jgi:hypothetical protein
MKKTLLLLVSFLLISCAHTVVQNTTSSSFLPGFGVQPLKIKKMAYISYNILEKEESCSITDFQNKYVGKILKKDNISIRIDNIINVSMEQIDKSKSRETSCFLFFCSKGFSQHKYKCHYEGYGVEYDLSDIEIINDPDLKPAGNIPAIEDEE